MGFFRRATPIDPAEVERLRSEITSLRDALERHDDTSRVLHDKVSSLDDRVTSVSTELTNQLTELGHDIDTLAARPAADGVDTEALEAMKAGQVRLASEQARYQIAFREDLARLAHELRRPR